MKKIIGILTIATVVFASFAMNVENKINLSVKQTGKHIYKNVKADEFKSLIDKNNGIILDVRTADEFNRGHIAGAINIDYYSISFQQNLDSLDKSKPVYVYCHSGNRSGKSMKMMSTMGFVEVYNLIGGFSNWPYKK